MCSQYDDPTFDPALGAHEPARDSGPLKPLPPSQPGDFEGYEEYLDKLASGKAWRELTD